MILTLEETKKYLRVDFDDDDELLESFILTGEKLVADVLRVEPETFLAMRRALEGLNMEPDFALVDGNRDPKLGIPTRCEVKGDGRYACIAAASVLAKVSRDRLMDELDGKYPGYGFKKHKGYPTKAHYEALAELGPSEIHRLTFLHEKQ